MPAVAGAFFFVSEVVLAPRRTYLAFVLTGLLLCWSETWSRRCYSWTRAGLHQEGPGTPL